MTQTTALIPANQETARQAAELSALRRMLDLSHDCFSLSLAICNSPALRDQLINDLRQSHPDIHVVQIPPRTIDVYGYVVSQPVSDKTSALFLIGLDDSVSSSDESQQTLQSLNASRELWEQRFPRPLILWLPEYAAELLSHHARDFYRYRSHRFEFVSEFASAAAAIREPHAGSLSEAANLSKEEKLFRIAELEQRVAGVVPNPDNAILVHVSIWLSELAFLYDVLGNVDSAEQVQRRALAIDEKLGGQENMASDYGNLGLINQTRGDLDKAEEMHRKALVVNEKLGRLEGMARNYGNLGLIYQTRGDLNKAEEMHRKALAIDEKRGGLEGMATAYGNLGLLYQVRGDLDTAEEMHRKSLAIEEKLGRLEGMASDCGNLGVIHLERGNLAKAEEAFRKALAIDEKLGHLEGMANQYANLGALAERQDDLVAARTLWTKARDLYSRVGISESAQRLQSCLGALPAPSSPPASAPSVVPPP